MDDPYILRTKKEYEDTINTLIQDERYDEGLHYLDQIENKVIETTWLNFYRGVLYNALDQYELALPYLMKAKLQAGKHSLIYSELGWTYNRLEDFDEALFYLEQVNEMGRDDYWLYSELAYTYLRKEMIEEALVYLDLVLSKVPQDEWALHQLAEISYDAGHYEEALNYNKQLIEANYIEEATLEDVIQLNEMLSDLDDQEDYLELYKQYGTKKDFLFYHQMVYLNNKECYDQVIAQISDSPYLESIPELKIELGYSYRQIGEYEKAMDYYLEAYYTGTKPIFLLSELASLCGIFEEYEHKEQFLLELYKAGRKDSWIYFNFARLYLYDLVDLKQARYYLDELKQIDATNEEFQSLEVEYAFKNKQEDLGLHLIQERLALRDSNFKVTFPKMDLDKEIKVNYPGIERIYEFYHDLAYIENHEFSGFIDSKGNLKMNFKFDLDQTKRQDTFMFYDQEAIVMQDGWYGMIDLDGHTTTEFMYDNILYQDGYKYLMINDLTIVKKGKQEHLFHDEVIPMKENRLGYKKEGSWGYLDDNFNEVIPCQYDFVEAFKDGLAVVRKADKWQLIDLQGQVYFSYEGSYLMNLGQGFFAIENEQGYLVFDSNKELLGIYEEVDSLRQERIAVKKENKWGFIDLQGNLKVDYEYDEVLPFFENYARVKKEGYYGMIDLEGQLFLPCIFDNMTIVRNATLIVGVGYRYGYMNLQRNFIMPILFSTATLPVDGKMSASYLDQFYILERGEKENERNDS